MQPGLGNQPPAKNPEKTPEKVLLQFLFSLPFGSAFTSVAVSVCLCPLNGLTTHASPLSSPAATLNPVCFAPSLAPCSGAAPTGRTTSFSLMIKCQNYTAPSGAAACGCRSGSLPTTFAAWSPDASGPLPRPPSPAPPAEPDPYSDGTVPGDEESSPQTDARHAALLGGIIGGVALLFLVLIPTAAHFINRKLMEMDKVRRCDGRARGVVWQEQASQAQA